MCEYPVFNTANGADTRRASVDEVGKDRFMLWGFSLDVRPFGAWHLDSTREYKTEQEAVSAARSFVSRS